MQFYSYANVQDNYLVPPRYQLDIDHVGRQATPIDLTTATKVLKEGGKVTFPSQSLLDDEILAALSVGGNLFVFLDDSTPIKLRDGFEVNFKELPKSEWFLRVNHALAVFKRAPEEVPVSSSIFIAQSTFEVEPIAWVNIKMTDRLVGWRASVGRGTIHVFGFDYRSLTYANEEARYLLEIYQSLGVDRDKPFGVSVVGYGPYGGMGHFHGTATNNTPGLQFVAAVDPNLERRSAAQREFPGIRSVADHREVLKLSDVEVVVVATPPSTHFTIALEALRAGKHVVLEKPMCLTVAEADQLITVAAQNDLVLTVNQNRRWDQDFRAVRNIIHRGEIGDVFNIETFVGTFDHPCRAWHSDEEISGGAAYDWGAHYIDWTLLLFDEAPSTISAIGHKRRWFEVSNLDQITIGMRFSNGREATFIQSDLAAVRKPKFYIQGTEGTVIGEYRPISKESVSQHDGYVVEAYHFAEAPATLGLTKYEGPGTLSYRTVALPNPQRFGFWRNFADHIHLGSRLEVNSAQVREVIAVLEEAHKATLAVQ